MLADTECFTVRLDREVFEAIIRDFPEIRLDLLEQANFRSDV
jgi:hypothetical protein